MSGVFITRGMRVAVPAGGLTFSIGDDGQLKGSSLTIHVHYDVCPTWLELAFRHLADAEDRGLARIAAWQSDDQDARAATLEREFESSMQAMMAAAIAATSQGSHQARAWCQILACLRREFPAPSDVVTSIVGLICASVPRCPCRDSDASIPALHRLPIAWAASETYGAGYELSNAVALAVVGRRYCCSQSRMPLETPSSAAHDRSERRSC